MLIVAAHARVVTPSWQWKYSCHGNDFAGGKVYLLLFPSPFTAQADKPGTRFHGIIYNLALLLQAFPFSFLA
jgi:hypothetical protein